MSDLIMLIHRNNNSRRFQRTLEGNPLKADLGGLTCVAGRPHLQASQPPWPHMLVPPSNVGFPLPPRLHLGRSLSRFDPMAHVASSRLYIPGPAPLRHKSFEKTETLIFLRAPPYSRT
jgi:hypothetical protein